jgi:hypothetical protein
MTAFSRRLSLQIEYVGTQLFASMKEWFRERSVCHIEIEAATANPESLNFWTKMEGREFIKRMQIRIT